MKTGRSVSGLSSVVGAGAVLWIAGLAAAIAPTPGAPNSFSMASPGLGRGFGGPVGGGFPGTRLGPITMSSSPVFAPRVGAGTAAAIRYTPQTSAAFAPRSSAGMMRASADFPAPPPASSVPSVPSVPRVQPPMAPANQFPTGPSNLPGTLPALNSNTLPALNSNTLPALNSNTLPALNSNTLPALNSNTAPLLNSGVVPILNSGTSPSLNSGTLPVLHSPSTPGFNGTTSSAALANLPQATPTTPSGNACPLPPPNPGCPVYCPPGWNCFPFYNIVVL